MTEPFRPPRRAAAPARPRRRWWPLVVVVAAILAINAVVLRPFVVDRGAPALTPSPSAVSATPTTPSATPTRSSTPAVRSKPPAQPKTLNQLSRGVVLIRGETSNSVSNGTGMVISADGLVVTNYHVVEETSTLQVTIAVTGERHAATVVGADPAADVALLKLANVSDLATVTFDDDPVAVGDAVVQVGNSNGQGFLDLAKGKIVDLNTTIEVDDEMSPSGTSELTGVGMTDAAAHPGDSGGPMYDDEGEVVGMTTAGSPGDDQADDPSETFHIPWPMVMAVSDAIVNGEPRGTLRVGPRPFLGVTIGEASTRVEAVVSGSPAQKAGLVIGSRVTGVNAAAVDSRADLYQALLSYRPGDTVTLHWTNAGGESQVSRVTLAANPLN